MTNSIATLVENLKIFLDNSYILSAIKFVMCIFYTGILWKLFQQTHDFKKNSFNLINLFIVVILGEFICESTLLIRFFLAKLHVTHYFILQLLALYIRFAWIIDIFGNIALAILIEKIANNTFKFNKRHFYTFIPGFILVFCYIYFALFQFNTLNFNFGSLKPTRIFAESVTITISSIYIALVTIPSIIVTLKNMRSKKLPKLLLSQLYTFIFLLIIPHVVLRFFSINPFASLYLTEIISSQVFQTIYTVFLFFAMYFSAKRIAGRRFLNINQHVQPTTTRFNFVQDFKEIIEQLSFITNILELKRITQEFYKNAFTIPQQKISLTIRADEFLHEAEAISIHNKQVQWSIETFINKTVHDDEELKSFLYKTKIIIKDEVEFTHFYEPSHQLAALIAFMDTIHADIFIPIYEKQSIIAYIIVDNEARSNYFYTTDDRDEMLIFTQYIGALINLIKNRNLDSLIIKEKELQEELYHKHQEINQYKESIRSFLRTNKERKIGIIFYKSRKFVYANQAAQELISINLNTQNGHPLTLAFKSVVRHVTEYRSAHTVHAKDDAGKRIILAGLPSIEDSYVIIAVYYPEISDVIKEHLDVLKNPSEWDYLLYLETTESGRLINQLIPGNSETLMHWKIDLLKIALNKKATLLQLPEEDLIPTVELLHHIHMRERLHTLKLTGPEKHMSALLDIFGINPLLQQKASTYIPLLEKLDPTGTLYIENIHFLHLETQQHLAEYLKYGLYRMFKSDRKFASSVRIICSSNHDLMALVEQGSFSRALYNELTKITLRMPPLSTLSSQEITELADGFTEQAITTKDLKYLVALSEKEKARIIGQRPASLQELRTTVQTILNHKSNKYNLTEEIEIDPAFSITDPELAHAVRLGKHALKDQKIMTFLWNKFKNQTKIATLLGVNRSSVNRRCQQFSLIDETIE